MYYSQVEYIGVFLLMVRTTSLALERAHDTRRPRERSELQTHSSSSGTPQPPSRRQPLSFDHQVRILFLFAFAKWQDRFILRGSTRRRTRRIVGWLLAVHGVLHPSRHRLRSQLASPRSAFPSLAAKSFASLPSFAMTRRSPLVSVILAGSAAGLMAAPTGMTSCYDSSAAPPTGYTHDPSNLVFTVERTMEPAIGYTTEYSRFTAVKCDAPSAHAFNTIEWCETNNCDSSCPISMPSECADPTKFGICAPTVKNICDSMQSSVTSCMDGSSKAAEKSAAHDGIDVQLSPCDDAIQKETADALKEYKSAYNAWANAYNNASQTCKVGTGIRDYNSNLLSPLSGKLESVENAALAVCGEEDFDHEASLPPKSNLGASERNKAICDKMRTNIAKLRSDAQTASAQIQCFGSKCVAQRDAENDAFNVLNEKYSAYSIKFDQYSKAAKDYNDLVTSKKIAKDAAIAEYGLFNDAMADNSAKFSKDSGVFDKFVSGAAKGSCGLTQCEIDAVCGNDIAQKTDQYAAKKDGKCKQVEFDSAEICYEEVADEKAKAAAEAAQKAAEEEAAKRAAEEQAAAEKAAAEAAERAAAEKAAAEAAEKAAAEKAAAEAAAKAAQDPFGACQQACAAQKQCCNNDISQGSNQKLSCLQACMVVKSGVSKSECLSYCPKSSCSHRINGITFDLCRTCDDVPAHSGYYGNKYKPVPYQCSATYGANTDTCEAGCEAGAAMTSIPSAEPALPPMRLGFNSKYDVTEAVKDCQARGWPTDGDKHCVMNAWDVSKVTDFGHMLRCSMGRGFPTDFNQDISKWDTSRVTDMNNLFAGCSSFNQDLSGWDVSNVRAANGLFSGCTVFNADISRWNPASATNWEYLFNYAFSFNQDLTSWRFPSNYDKWRNFFNRAKSFKRENAPPQAMASSQAMANCCSGK